MLEEPVAPRFDKPALNLQRKPQPDRQVLSVQARNF